MTARKSAPRRKRAAPAPSCPKKKQAVVAKKKQAVVAKKKHVRELAKAGRWVEIERLYGEKIVAKAKTYAEKHCVAKTPQEIARDILLKNGYVPSAPQAAATSSMGRGMGTSSHVNAPASAALSGLHSSPETLTKEQEELIEKRRRDALERRRRAQQVVNSTIVPLDQAEAAVMPRGRPPIVPIPRPLPRYSREATTVQVRSNTHRVVTPENLPTTSLVVEPEQLRPEYFWDDLEAAAEIVQWENEHMAEVAIVQPPVQPLGNLQATQNAEQQRQSSPAVSKIPSLSQEIAAAAEIIQWEKEHEDFEAPACSKQGDNSNSDAELDAPQFQLLPVQITDEVERHEQKGSEPRLRVNQAVPRPAQPNKELQPNSKPHRKRPLEVRPPPALPRSSSAISSEAANPRAGTQHHFTSSDPPQCQRDPTAEFIDKHLLEDKLELPVLEFLDMMLA